MTKKKKREKEKNSVEDSGKKVNSQFCTGIIADKVLDGNLGHKQKQFKTARNASNYFLVKQQEGNYYSPTQKYSFRSKDPSHLIAT